MAISHLAKIGGGGSCAIQLSLLACQLRDCLQVGGQRLVVGAHKANFLLAKALWVGKNATCHAACTVILLTLRCHTSDASHRIWQLAQPMHRGPKPTYGC